MRGRVWRSTMSPYWFFEIVDDRHRVRVAESGGRCTSFAAAIEVCTRRVRALRAARNTLTASGQAELRRLGQLDDT